MASATQRPEKASRLPIKVLAGDERAFDAELVRSALRFLERFSQPRKERAAVDAVALFGWVPDVVLARARAIGVEIKPTVMSSGADFDHFNTLAVKLRLAIEGLQSPGDAASAESVHRWLSKELERLRVELSVRPVYRAGAWRRVEIPVLFSVERCIAYAMFVLLEDRWGFRERVRMCPYKRKRDQPPRGVEGEPSYFPGHFEPDHWFLDVDEAGLARIGPPQQFCSAAHANAFRQRKWRRSQQAK